MESSWGEGAGDEARGMAGQQGYGIALVDVEGGAVQGCGDDADEAAGLGVGIELLQGGPAELPAFPEGPFVLFGLAAVLAIVVRAVSRGADGGAEDQVGAVVEEADDVGQGVDRAWGGRWPGPLALRADLPVILRRGWCFGARGAEIGLWRAVGARNGGYWPGTGRLVGPVSGARAAWPWAGACGGRLAGGVVGGAALRADLPEIRRGGWCLAPGGGENGLCGGLGACAGRFRLGTGLSGREPSGAGLARRRSTSAAVEGLAALRGLFLGLSPGSFLRGLPRASGGDVDGTVGLGRAVLLLGPFLFRALRQFLAWSLFLAALFCLDCPVAWVVGIGVVVVFGRWQSETSRDRVGRVVHPVLAGLLALWGLDLRPAGG